MALGLGSALAAGLSGAANVAGQSKYVDAYRNQRSRVGRALGFGRSMYGIRADQALAVFMESLGRAQEATQLALNETTRAGQTGFADLSSNLDRQLSRARTGIGSTLAASTFGASVDRGIFSDYRRDVGALHERIGSRRAGIQMEGAARENAVAGALANALFRRGAAEFDMQQAMAGRFGNVAPPQSYDFGELGASLDKLGLPELDLGGLF